MIKTEQKYLELYNDMESPYSYITDYLHETGDINATFSEMADNATPVYIGELLDWYGNNLGQVAQYVDEQIQYHQATDMYSALTGGFYDWQRDKIDEHKADMLELWTYGYIFKIKQIAEITEAQAEAIDDLDFDDYDDFTDIINDIDEILEPETDE